MMVGSMDSVSARSFQEIRYVGTDYPHEPAWTDILLPYRSQIRQEYHTLRLLLYYCELVHTPRGELPIG